MNSYCRLSLTTTGQSVAYTAGTPRDLPPRQSERDLMLNCQSPVLVRAPQLLPAQSPLPALVGGEPSTRAGHWRWCAQARRGNGSSPTGSTKRADHLPLTSFLLLTNII